MTRDQLIGTSKTGEILGYSGDYIRELCGDKEKKRILGAEKVGKVWLFRKSHIEEVKITGKLKARKKRISKSIKKN